MSKNTEMFKSFIKIMLGKEDEIDKIIPNMYVKNIYEINYKYLKKINKTNLIFDIDNTILPVDNKNVTPELQKLFEKLKKENFKICIMSNNEKNRVQPVGKKLKVQYLYKANKPKKEAFQAAIKKLNASKDNTIMIGDQMLSDIKGAKEYQIYSILTDPLTKHQNIKTRTSRILQDIIEKKLSKKNIFTPKKYYIKEE